ncbi:hypothetical protein A8924_5216 [Saccharopolyspora erythraea NRRL 2338]|uniref:Uncharacterized protein n=2 Tax=Saccharopolyspora erythraea TaxID=1836 RepID=A4FJ72_SACEN|nr:hypothetical protein [Saccharopolyspora erythraea]EQD83567.1 hypothetical protein N599_24645 [Saccharopolyspora erythraea D]PFG97766.1 hypothetical protein A8924_5216 [Saccharopolyspora erythraea NRRL 2338]QRK87913.1 hypothetical protein JQX30_24555 [Saccharopolyspora erythraea]CAM04097.1 hypothetical protein SACE_4832 [Saccharopolyspora erythraea NRRL 2338]
MTGRTVHRLDEAGTVRDWLVAGAWGEPVAALPDLVPSTGSSWGRDGRWVLTNGPDVTPLKARLHRAAPLREQAPPAVVEGGPVSYTGPDGSAHAGTWRRTHTAGDGLVDWSEFCFTPQCRVALAATALEVDQAEWRTLRLASTGPTLLYVNGECVARSESVTYMEPAEQATRVWLPPGVNEVVVCSWQVGFRECRQILRLRVEGLPVRVVLPSPGADERIGELAEQVLDSVGTPSWGNLGTEVELHGPDGPALRVEVGGVGKRVRLDGGKAVVELPPPDSGERDSASMLSTGEAVLRVFLDDERSPVFREFPVRLLPRHYRAEPAGDERTWRRELLEHARTQPNGCAGELASAALDPGHRLHAESLDRSLWMIEKRADCADFEALGLLHLWHRLPEGTWPEGVRTRVADALRGFKYWIDQPGLDAMCYFTENHQLVWHTAELLAGQTFADEVFANSGWTGRQHAEHGRVLAEKWLVRKLAAGFSEFDSNAYVAVDVLALVSLVEFADDAKLAELAAGLLDKTLFTLAVNSWRGAHACAHGRSYVHTQRSARMEETASIMWVCWGTGALNAATLPATVLATAHRYTVPEAIVAAAQELPEEWIGRQRYAGEYRSHHDLLSRPYASDLLVYKTPDVMLSSVQDYRSGLPGLQEHVWGAVLGPETQVHVTHPPSAATHSSARPNAWAGHRVLPRTRQHTDTVLAVHDIPEHDPMGFTHGWFPLSTMDEWTTRGPWVAGRRAEGYVALATEGGCGFLTSGPNAWQELRPRGPGVAWVCVVGRGATDGSFAEFVDALGEPDFRHDGVEYRTRHGVRLALHRHGAFTIDGRVADLDENGRPAELPHLDNPLCRVDFGAPEMVIGEKRHVIDLRTGRSLPG